MAEDPGKTPGTPVKQAAPQMIPLAKIHDLPGVFIPKQPDRSYGGMVSSIQAGGVKGELRSGVAVEQLYRPVVGEQARGAGKSLSERVY